jgi:adenine deaminase
MKEKKKSQKKKWKVIILVVVLLVVIGFLVDRYWMYIYSLFTSRQLNSKGGDITITNARIWTGDPEGPWKSAMTIRSGKIAAMDADKPAGKIFDAKGRLVVPGLWDSHCHPQVPYTLISPESPL